MYETGANNEDCLPLYAKSDRQYRPSSMSAKLKMDTDYHVECYMVGETTYIHEGNDIKSHEPIIDSIIFGFTTDHHSNYIIFKLDEDALSYSFYGYDVAKYEPKEEI